MVTVMSLPSTSFPKSRGFVVVLPNWAKDTSLLDHDFHKVVVRRVQYLNTSAADECEWYDDTLTTRDRARIILKGIVSVDGEPCWTATNIDKFAVHMNKIVWPEVTHQFRAKILAAEEKANTLHRHYKGECFYCRYKAYEDCALDIVTAVLDSAGKWESQSRTFRSHSMIYDPFTKTTSERPKPAPLRHQWNLPLWVRRPNTISSNLNDGVLEIITELNDFHEVPAWRLQLTTHQRVALLVSRLQREYERRVLVALQDRNVMVAAMYVFDVFTAHRVHGALYAEMWKWDESQSVWAMSHKFWDTVTSEFISMVEAFEMQAAEKTNPVVKFVKRLLNAE